MTIIFENKYSGKTFEVEDVKFFTTDGSCLGCTGFDVHYNDGTFNLYDKTVWKLCMVK